jgi:serine/threonine protein kinase
MPLTVQNVYGLLLRSKLLGLDDAKAVYQRWQNEAKTQADDLERFRRWLIGHHYLTEYQVGLLCRGKADGFFIGDYKILDRLGRGRMAGVYKAVHTTGQVLAIKVLPPSRAKDHYMLSRFQREARLAIRLKHVNIVRTFQLGEADGLQFIVMEYLDGDTLDEILQRRKRLAPVEAVRVIHQVLQGLQHIHEQGMIHRDLKPSNLMLTPGRQSGQPDTTLNASVKILDIGLGREFFDENAPVRREEEPLTGENVLLGTPDYLAPEQARNARAVDIRADIYSLGCVLYHCLAGHPPFPDSNIMTQMLRHAQETPKPLKEINPEVPEGLQQVVSWMMSKDPAQRYPTPERAGAALQVFLPAGMEKPRSPELEPSMSQFLLWLEKGNNGANRVPPTMRPGQQAVPVARPAVPPPAGSPPAPSQGSRSGKTKKHRNRHRKRKSKGSIAIAPKKKKFDVELVAVPEIPKDIVPTPPVPAQGRKINVSRRDLLAFGLGAGSVIMTGIVGGIAASGGVTSFLRLLGIMEEEMPPGKPNDGKK